MALFVKRSDEDSEIAQLYTFGKELTKVFIGLGNMGKEYDDTRHNVGFMVLDEFADSVDASWTHKSDLKCHLAQATVGGTKVYLVKPTTFMNRSGDAVQAIMQFYKISLDDVVIVHDEVDLDLGKIQVKSGGGHAGHNGLRDISAQVGEDYTRLRIGIGPKDPPQMDLSDFVLQRFSAAQLDDLQMVTKEAASMLGEATADHLKPETRTVIF